MSIKVFVLATIRIKMKINPCPYHFCYYHNFNLNNYCHKVD